MVDVDTGETEARLALTFEIGILLSEIASVWILFKDIPFHPASSVRDLGGSDLLQALSDRAN